MAVATMTKKGQVTIPKSIRDALGLHSGDKLEFIIDESGRVLCTPVTRRVDDVFGRLHRSGRKAVSIEEMDACVRRKIGGDSG